jgi:fumarate reductase subunit C
MKAAVYTLFVLLYGAVTFFGLGPVFMADGSTQERMITLAVVLVIYAVITALLIYFKRRSS